MDNSLQTTARLLEESQAYIELGLLEDGWRILDEITLPHQHAAPVLALRVRILAHQGARRRALRLVNVALKVHPDFSPLYYLKAAIFAGDERHWEAKKTLESMPEELQDTELFHHCLAYHERQIGNLDEASAHQETAMWMRFWRQNNEDALRRSAHRHNGLPPAGPYPDDPASNAELN